MYNQQSYGENKFLLLNCPWCGEKMGMVDNEVRGYKIEKKRFTFSCYDENCDFHSNNLPIYLIDDTIYKVSPDLLIGTIDKFASLPWNEKAIASFQSLENKLAPELIVQDELHLISGPLGSVSGMYEILIDSLFENKMNK